MLSLITILYITLRVMQASSMPTTEKQTRDEAGSTGIPSGGDVEQSASAITGRLRRINFEDFASSSPRLNSIPRRIADSVDDLSEDSNDFKSSRMFIFPKTNILSDKNRQAAAVLRFTFSSKLLSKGTLQLAKMFLFVDGLAGKNHSSKSIMSAVERLASSSVTIGSVEVQDKGWTTISLHNRIKLLLEQQLKEKKQDLIVDVMCEQCGDEFHIVADKLLDPYLELEFRKATKLNRKKRSADCTSANDTCCRDVVDVDLDELGFDQVIIPRQFKAYFCRGACLSDNTDELANTIQSAINVAPRQSCCAPKRTKALSLLYAGEGAIFQTKIPDFIVLECACT